MVLSTHEERVEAWDKAAALARQRDTEWVRHNLAVAKLERDYHQGLADEFAWHNAALEELGGADASP